MVMCRGTTGRIIRRWGQNYISVVWGNFLVMRVVHGEGGLGDVVLAE